MKINILNKPPEDIFKDKLKHVIIFIALLALSFFGVLLGAYAIFADTHYYSQLENWSLFTFVAPTPFITFVGGKIQEYKRLTPPERDELSALGQQYPEVKVYTDLVAASGREPIRVEYRSCKDWVEETEHQIEKKLKKDKKNSSKNIV